jgi:DNA-binding NarL/FixJ family response regulator
MTPSPERSHTRDVAGTAAQQTRIVVVDDHTLFRQGLRLIIELEHDLACVGEASTVDEALALIAQTSPDLVLLDLRLAQASGIGVLSQLASTQRAPRVLVVTAFPEEADVAEAVRLGAKGVVLKDATRHTMIAAIRAVAAGQPWLPPELSAKVIAALTRTPPAGAPQGFDLLTPREQEIVALVGQGLKNREIAERLAIAEKTIKGHLTSVFYKLGVQDRLGLALLAVKTRFTPPAPR